MTNDAIINKQQITLTEEEQRKAEEFHKSRIAFIYHKDIKHTPGSITSEMN